MIARLRGMLLEVDGAHAILDVGGVGYLVQVGSGLASRLEPGVELSLSISTQVREDAISLYGFSDPAERKVFDLLLGVSGVGPKLALALVDTLGLKRLNKALNEDDARTLCSVSGVGKKTAQRLLLELRGKLMPVFEPNNPTLAPKSAEPEDPLRLALARLGYRKSEVDRAVAGLKAGGRNDGTLQERLSGSLRILSGGRL
jgi:Holliday junction DNA helicase RuvA